MSNSKFIRELGALSGQTNFMKFIAKTLLGLIATSSSAFTFSLFWKWFVVPVFSLPVLTFLQSLGLLCFSGFIVMPIMWYITERDLPKEQREWQLIGNIILTLFMLLNGFLISLFL